ncbi:PAS-domain containing protein [Hwanghaeella sp. LZ110]|jgi:serine phosphatase RsbU (regulator of sigma subunit)|uniref:PAS-domain containing protein n=1 Tax=Hwanghaeella sp. LZ110 TaxID=3402810 RepID=UPI003B68531A
MTQSEQENNHREAGRRDEDHISATLREAACEIDQGLLVIDADMNVVFANPPYLKMNELPVDCPFTQEGQPFERLLDFMAQEGKFGPGDTAVLVAQHLKPAQERTNFDLDRTQPKGGVMHVTGVALKNGGYVYTFNDVTDRVAEQQRLDRLVQEQTIELQEANKQLTDGIEYARLIQTGILPNRSFFETHLGDHFLLFRPVDIVGGDFYIGVRTDFGIYVGLGDCTGHGIPGAMMTMMAASVCRRAINDTGVGGPVAVMMAVDRIVRTNLHQTGAQVGPDNGLELTLCLIEPEFKRIRLASAGLESFVQSKGKIERIRGSKLGLGYGRQATSAATLQETVLSAKEAERIFLSSDGILDQSGGEKGFGFGRRRLVEALGENVEKPIEDQGQALLQTLESYRGNYPQRDDLTVLGFCPLQP